MKSDSKIVSQNELRLQLLEELAEELVKTRPKIEKIKQYMNQTGLDFHEDPVANIASVFQALQFQASGLDIKGAESDEEIEL